MMAIISVLFPHGAARVIRRISGILREFLPAAAAGRLLAVAAEKRRLWSGGGREGRRSASKEGRKEGRKQV